MNFNNQMQNFNNAPGFIIDEFANRPVVAAVGTMFVSTDTYEIFVYTTVWLNVGTGTGGGGQNLQQVTDIDNITSNNIVIYNNSYLQLAGTPNTINTVIDHLQIEINDSVNNKITNIDSDQIKITEGGNICKSTAIDVKLYNNSGLNQLQLTPYKIDINAGEAKNPLFLSVKNENDTIKTLEFGDDIPCTLQMPIFNGVVAVAEKETLIRDFAVGTIIPDGYIEVTINNVTYQLLAKEI